MKTITSILFALSLMHGLTLFPNITYANDIGAVGSVYSAPIENGVIGQVKMSKWDQTKDDQINVVVAQQNMCTCQTYVGTTCSGPCDFAGMKPLGCFCK